MHSFHYGTYDNKFEWIIHHNGGFAGDIIIVCRSPDGTYVTARTTSERVLCEVSFYAADVGRPTPFFGKDDPVFDVENDVEAQLVAPIQVLAAFVADRYVRRGLEYWVEGLDDEAALKMLHWFHETIRKGKDGI